MLEICCFFSKFSSCLLSFSKSISALQCVDLKWLLWLDLASNRHEGSKQGIQLFDHKTEAESNWKVLNRKEFKTNNTLRIALGYLLVNIGKIVGTAYQ